MNIADIPGHPNYYINTNGVVFKKVLKRKSDSYIVSQFISRNGYAMVTLRENGSKKNRTVHSLILCAFYGDKREFGLVSRHIDGNKLNNNVNNLEWGTVSQNHNDKKRHGTFQCGEKHGKHKLTEKDVIYIRNSDKTWVELQNMFNVSSGAIKSAKNGWKHVSEQATERAMTK